MPGVIPSETRSSRLLSLIATILVVATLYLAREVLIPVALAVLLAFLLTPLVIRLQRWGLRRIPAVMLVSVLSFAAIALVGYVISVEAISLAESLPQYRQNIRAKVRAISAPSIFSRATENLRQTTKDVIEATTQAVDPTTSQPATAPAHIAAPASSITPDAAATQPMLVTLAEPRSNAMTALTQTVQPLLGPLGTAGIIMVFVIFMLIQREALRDRLVALTGESQINVTTTAFDDAAQRVSRYLLMQFVVNVTYGIAAAIGLTLIGVPNALLWGMLCVVLRYIPYVGPWLAAAMPILLALAVFDDWSRPLMVIGLFVVLEIISNNVIEPWLYGSGTGVSSMAILLAAVFWTWLWGVPGLVLSTPLTVCLVVLGRHVPQMRWLVVLLGEEPGLPLPSRVYQRLLAADQEEVIALAQVYLKDHTLLAWYDDVLIPALGMAEVDRHEGALDDRRQQSVFAAMREVIDELGETTEKARKVAGEAEPDKQPKGAKSASPTTPAPAAIAAKARPLILIVAAHDDADELAAIMLAQLLAHENQQVEVLPSTGLTGQASDLVAAANPSMICVSSMPPMAIGHARYICKRLRERLTDARLIVGVWNASDIERATQRMRPTDGEKVVGSLATAIEALRM